MRKKKIWYAHQKDGGYVYARTGMELAKKLGLTRNAVYSAIKRAKDRGWSCRYGCFEEEDDEQFDQGH